MENNVSIVICYYNGGEKLRPTIEHIKNLDLSVVSEVELLFVDNNSNDDSNVIIRQELSDFRGFSWRIVEELKPGLANGRLKGFKEAKYDIILFCDDDNWLAPSYIDKGIKVLRENNKVAVLGGKGEGVSDIPLPSWFFDNERFFAVGSQFSHSGKVEGKRNVVYGAGMFVRKLYFEAIQRKGFEFYNLGRVGGKLTAGEDSEMCLAFQIAGYDIWYEESLKFKHYMDPKRLNRVYFKKLSEGMDSSRYVSRFYLDFMNGYTPKVTKTFWLKEFIHAEISLVKAVFQGNISEVKRIYSFGTYVLRERRKYNEDVKRIITICRNLVETKN